MKPVSGEKPPLRSISRSQIWRGVRSQDGKSRESALVSAACSRSRMRLMSSPPCGGMRWLVPSVVFKGVMFLLIAVVALLRGEAAAAEAGRPATRQAEAQVCTLGENAHMYNF